ncbi:UNVERIFIED_CONTAM: hypothetical protein ABID98_001750 [Brevibacillus sp. OAP136]
MKNVIGISVLVVCLAINGFLGYYFYQEYQDNRGKPLIPVKTAPIVTAPSVAPTAAAPEAPSATALATNAAEQQLAPTPLEATAPPQPQPVDETDNLTPIQARQELGKLAISYTDRDFIIASKNNDILAVKLFLRAGMSPNVSIYIDKEWISPLSNAVLNGNLDNLKRMLEAAGGDPNLRYSFYDNVLTLNIENPQVVRLLLEHGANPNFTDDMNEHFWTPLYKAVKMKRLECIKTLIEFGADPNQVVAEERRNFDTYNKDIFRLTPLQLAEQMGLTEIANVLKQAPQKQIETDYN